MKSVFVVQLVENEVDCKIISAHATEETAMKAALEQPCKYAGGWRRAKGDHPESVFTTRCWLNGFHFVRVIEMELKE